MEKLKIYKVLFLLLIFSSVLIAQDKEKDSSKDKKGRKYKYYLIKDDFFYKGSPSMEFSYGQSNISLKNYGSEIQDAGILELKLGWHKEKNTYSKKIVKYKNNFMHGAYISSNIKASNSTSGAPTTLRFGLGSSSGYGYKLGTKASMLLYNSNSFTWTRYDYGTRTYTMEYTQPPFDKLDDFNQSLRFGSSTEGGIIIPLTGIINLQAAYDRTIVFPRHMVWKQLGSVMLETASQSLIDAFVFAVFKSSPAAAPVVSFLLKNGLSYGLYELRREEMNWPFNTAEPLLFDSYKLGLTFTF